MAGFTGSLVAVCALPAASGRRGRWQQMCARRGRLLGAAGTRARCVRPGTGRALRDTSARCVRIPVAARRANSAPWVHLSAVFQSEDCLAEVEAHPTGIFLG